MDLFRAWNIPCERISGGPEQVMERFLREQRAGSAAGWTPLIYMETDSDMLEAACEEALDEFGSLDAFAQRVRAAASEVDAGAYRCGEWARIRADLEAGLFDELSGGEVEDGFALEGARRLFLLRVPVAEPWRVFERIPFGGFGDCPDNGVHMAFARMWHERYGAAPAVISDCGLQYLLPELAKPDPALNDQLVNYCPALTEYIHPSEFAGQFSQVRVWFFFWD